MITTEVIRDWFLQCPTVDTVLDFNTDYLGDSTNACTIYSLPTNLKYTEDVVGNISFNTVQSLNFIFALRAPYGDDVRQNLDNLGFFDNLKDWMYEQNTLKNFPIIDDGEVKSIMPIQTEFISSATSDTAMYEMHCELKYWRNK